MRTWGDVHAWIYINVCDKFKKRKEKCNIHGEIKLQNPSMKRFHGWICLFVVREGAYFLRISAYFKRGCA